MKKEFLSCDRCGSALLNGWERREITISMISEKTGKSEFELVDLCDDCINSLIKWFGSYNPLTGKLFIKL